MNSYLQGTLVTVDNGPDGFQITATGANADPAVVLVTVQWVTGPADTYTYGVGSFITRSAEGFYSVNVDSTGMSNNVCTVTFSGDPDGTPSPVCQAINKRQFSTYT